MAIITFATFDTENYQRAPRTTLEGTMTLCRALLDARLDSEPVHVTAAADKLISELRRAESAGVQRHIELDPGDPQSRVELDAIVDRTWRSFYAILDAYAAMKGIAETTERLVGDDVPAWVDAIRELGTQAGRLLDRVFVGEGLAFLQGPYVEQDERMRRILTMIEDQSLRPELENLVEPDLLEALVSLQHRYTAMVRDRLLRDERSRDDLNELRLRLQRALTRYCRTVLSVLDEDLPETLDRVANALRPMETFRVDASRSPLPPSASPTEPDDTASSPPPPPNPVTPFTPSPDDAS